MVGELRWSCYIILFIIFKAPLKDETFLSSVAFEELVCDYLSVSLNFAFTFGFPCSNILILLPTFFVMNKSVIVKQHFFSRFDRRLQRDQISLYSLCCIEIEAGVLSDKVWHNLWISLEPDFGGSKWWVAHYPGKRKHNSSWFLSGVSKKGSVYQIEDLKIPECQKVCHSEFISLFC